MPEERHQYPSDLLEGVVSNRATDYVTVGEMKDALHERGFALLIILFAAVTIVTPPGITPVPALPVTLLSLQILTGKDAVWLPGWLSRKKLKRLMLASIIEKATPFMRRAERVLHPRMTLFIAGAGERVMACFMLVFSLSIMVPLPLTNFLPAVGTILICLGIAGRDGLFALAGVCVGVSGVLITLGVLLFGSRMMEFIRQFLPF